VLPWMPQWRDLADPLQDLRDQLTRPAGDLPRAVRGYLAALAALRAALDTPDTTAVAPAVATSSSPGLRSPGPPGHPIPAPPPVTDRVARAAAVRA